MNQKKTKNLTTTQEIREKIRYYKKNPDQLTQVIRPVIVKHQKKINEFFAMLHSMPTGLFLFNHFEHLAERRLTELGVPQSLWEKTQAVPNPFNILFECSKEYEDYLNNIPEKENLETGEWTGRQAAEVYCIAKALKVAKDKYFSASLATELQYRINSLTENSNRVNGKKGGHKGQHSKKPMNELISRFCKYKNKPSTGQVLSFFEKIDEAENTKLLITLTKTRVNPLQIRKIGIKKIGRFKTTKLLCFEFLSGKNWLSDNIPWDNVKRYVSRFNKNLPSSAIIQDT